MSSSSNPQRSVAIYHVVKAHERFETAAQHLFELVQKAQRDQPGRRRVVYLDIQGHRNEQGGFDADMLELQQEFLIGFFCEYVAELVLPLARVVNTKGQRDDLPERLDILAKSEGPAS